jgi:hypothetical protein
MKYIAQLLVLCLAAFLRPAAACAESPWDDAKPVSAGELAATMRTQKEKGYAIEAIANSNRLLTAVFLELAETAAKTDPAQHPLRIGHAEYFNALVEVAGLTAATAPIHIRVPHDFHQDYLIDYRRERVIAGIVRGPTPLLAINVKGGWPQAPDVPPNYSYEDTSSDPHVEVTDEQVISYRILQFGDVIVCDDIRGITGRVTSGPLGLLFSMLGKGQALHSRYVVAPDGTMLSRTGAKKLITVTKTVAIFPDGTLLSELPDDKPELEKLAKALKDLDFAIRFVPMDTNPVPAP